MNELPGNDAAAIHVPPAARLQAVSAGTIVAGSVRLLRQCFGPVALITLLVQLPLLVLGLTQFDFTADPKTLGTMFLVLILGALMLGQVAAAPISYVVFMRLRGTPVSFMGALAGGFKRVLPAFASGFIVGTLEAIGSRLFYIPGILARCMFFVAVPAAVLEKPGVFGALGRSARLTKGYRWSIFGTTFCIGAAMFGTLFVGALIVGILGHASPAMVVVGFWLLLAMYSSWSSVAAAVAYHDLRIEQEGLVTNDLLSVFE